jgi:RNA polymerase sigma-70 factor (ECF subfamily)
VSAATNVIATSDTNPATTHRFSARRVVFATRRAVCGIIAAVTRRERQTNPPQVGFPTTHWTLVNRAASADSVAQPLAIAQIARLYAPALRAHLLQSLRYDEHRTDDLLQGFLADKVLEQRLIGHADPQRGRFRTFLLSALDRYVIDQHRRNTARKRAPRGGDLADIDDHRDTLASGRNGESATHAFDLAWAREVLGEVLAVMRRQCEQTDRIDVWTVFECRYLMPAIEGVDTESHESLAKRLKLDSPHQAANLLITAKRMYTRLFIAVVSRYAANEDEVRNEVAELWRIFASARR